MSRRDDGTEDFDTRCRGTESCDCPDCMADDEYDDETGGRCYWCGGDGWTECDDPIQCTSPHNEFGECQCSPCNGTGSAKHQWLW